MTLRRLILSLTLITTSCTAPQNSIVDLAGQTIDPLGGNSGVIVLIFVRTDCPISNRLAPEMTRIHQRFDTQTVAFWLVYVDRDEGPDAIRKHLADFDLRFDVARDLDHKLVAIVDAHVTPEAAVFDANGRLVYHGRINDMYVDFGKTQAVPTSSDLIDSIEAALAGAPIETPHQPAVGCLIDDLKD